MKASLQYTSNSKKSPSILSSAINSRKSSQSKLLANQQNDSYNKKQSKIDIISLKKSLKQSRPHNIYSQTIQFEQSDTKLKKNLMKQFQTFNINQNDQQQLRQTKNQKKSQKKHTPSKQRTTQAKSPLSKIKLSTKKNSIQARTQHIQREKRQSQLIKSSISQSKSKSLQHKKPLQNKSILKQQVSQTISNQNNFHLNFPQLITQSQQVYPNSSYPNTEKNQSKNSQNNDYISEETQYHQKYSKTILQDKSQQYFRKDKNFNIPRSYIIAMETLQHTVQAQQAQIQQLKLQLDLRNHQLSQVQSKYATLKNQFQKQNQQIQNKHKQIGFLKGYLDQVKQNNRQALKQVSKNVYQRSLSNFANRDNQTKKRQSIKLKNKEQQILRQKQALDKLEIEIQNRKQIEQDIINEKKLNANRNSLSNLNRERSISTAVKSSTYQNIYRKPRRYEYFELEKQKIQPVFIDRTTNNIERTTDNIDRTANNIDRTTNKNDIKKSVTSKYLYANSQQKHHYKYQIQQKEKVQKICSRRVQVSQMREIMRYQKQLVALNYKLQAIQTKIYNCVKSTKSTPRQQLKYNKFQTNQPDHVLDNLKKQYNLIKREAEIKQNQIKTLRFKMDKEQNVQRRLLYNHQL